MYFAWQLFFGVHGTPLQIFWLTTVIIAICNGGICLITNSIHTKSIAMHIRHSLFCISSIFIVLIGLILCTMATIVCNLFHAHWKNTNKSNDCNNLVTYKITPNFFRNAPEPIHDERRQMENHFGWNWKWKDRAQTFTHTATDRESWNNTHKHRQRSGTHTQYIVSICSNDKKI